VKLRQVKNRDRSTLRRSGRCFKCDEQTPYGDGTGRGLCNLHVQFGDEWLDRAFASGFTTYPSRYMKPYLCCRCRSELEAEERAATEEDRRRKASDEARARFEKTWRKPTPGEFPERRGEKRFLVVEAGYGYQEVVFRFRVSHRWCVGSRPVFVYAMFVEGKLEARTYHDSGDQDTDPIALCFGIWFQNRWQDKLIASEHATDVWQAKAPGRSRLDSWDYTYGGQGLWPSWSLVHTVWTDGSVYAAVENMRTFANVEDFAKKVLDAQVGSVTKGRRTRIPSP